MERLLEDSMTGWAGLFFKASPFDFSEDSGTIEGGTEEEDTVGFEAFTVSFSLLGFLVFDCLEGIWYCLVGGCVARLVLVFVLVLVRKLRNLGKIELVVGIGIHPTVRLWDCRITR